MANDSSFLDSQVALAETAFGQGQLLATPIQMALIAACIANDGQMMAPYLVQSITNQDGDVPRRVTLRSGVLRYQVRRLQHCRI